MSANPIALMTDDRVTGPTIINGDRARKDRLIELVRDCYDQAVRYRQPLDEKRLKWWKNYNSISEKIVRADTGQEIKSLSNLFMPWTYGFIEQRVPRIIGRLPEFAVYGEDQEFDQEWTEAIQQLLRKDLERAGYFMSAIIHIKQAEIYGWSVRTNFWRYQMGKRMTRRPVREPMSGVQIGTESTEESFVEWDDPYTEVCDIWRCYTQPGSLSIDSADWFIHESIQSRKSIFDKMRLGVYDEDEVRKLFTESPGVKLGEHSSLGGSTLTDNPFWQRQQALGLSTNEIFTGSDHYPRHRIVNKWTDTKVLTIADNQYLLRESNNVYGRKPYRELKVVPIPFMQEGKGAAEVLADIQKAYNVQENQRIDAINLAINKVVMGPDDACDWDNFIMFPGNRVRGDYSRLHWVEVPPVGGDSYQETQRLLEVGQFAVAINDYLAPSQGSRTHLNKTKGGIELIQEQSNVIFSMISELFDLQDVGPTAIDFYQLRQRFQDRKRVMRVLGRKGYQYVSVTPEDLQWYPDIKPVGGSAQPQNKQQESERSMAVFNTLFGNPVALQLGIDMKEVLESFLRGIGERNVERFYAGKPETILDTIAKEHEAMAFGQPVPSAGDDQQHLALHLIYAQSPSFREQIPEKSLVLFQDHIRGHQAKLDRSPNSSFFDRKNEEEAKKASELPVSFGG